MYCLSPLLFTTLLGLLVAARPTPHTPRASIKINQVTSCVYGSSEGRDSITRGLTARESNTTTTIKKTPAGNTTCTVTGPDTRVKVDLIPEAFLEGDSDSGGESDVGNTAVSVANGLLGGGTSSAALNNASTGATSVFCSLISCAAAAASGHNVSTEVSGGNVGNVTGPLISITAPIILVSRQAHALVSQLSRITSRLA